MRSVGHLAVLSLVGCFSTHEDHVKGTPADMQTTPGDHASYRMTYPCAWSNVVGLVGLGTVDVRNVDDLSSIGSDLLAELRDVRSVWGGGGYGLVCDTTHVGTEVDLDDWRDVDTVIARAGSLLAARNLAIHIGISVGTPPVPVSNP
jgi:hypothetical protein